MRRALFASIAMSILTLPLALLQKISIAGAEFSASYLFIACIILWVGIRVLSTLPRNLDKGPAPAVVLPALMMGLCLFYGVINGFDGGFITAMLFWTVFTYLGMQFSAAYAANFLSQMTWLGTCTAFVGLVLYAINIPLIDLKLSGGDQYFVDGWGHYRASAIFLNPNSFGYFLVFFFSVRLFGAERAGRSGWLSTSLVIVALFFSGSRSAWIACGFLVTLRAVVALRPRVRLPLLIVLKAILLMALLTLLIFSPLLMDHDIRFEKWSFSLDIFTKQTEYVGMGLPENRPLEYMGIFFSDNMFLTVLFRLGAVGFAAFASYYLFVVCRACQCVSEESAELRPYAAFLLVASILFFYSNFLSFYPMVLMHGVATGVLLGRRFPTATAVITSSKAA